ncbi:hypothetical protein, partial [Vibrio aestuarianus]|uniref:hypothetical protein n=2 Tax=Vibrio aestuarianus TaxID=28171 RepID=UPI0031452F6C
RLFKNPFRPSQLAENTERILNEIVALTLKTHPTHNALLRCEQHNTDAAAYHLKHKTQRIVKMPRVANHS